MNDLPAGWKRAALADVCQVSPRDPALPAAAPFVPMAAVEAGQRYPRYFEEKHLRGGVRAGSGDILFARITPCLENGKLAQVPAGLPPVGGSTEFIVIRPGAEIDPAYLYYWCQEPGVRAKAKSMMAGVTGRMRLNSRELAKFEILFPPVREQRRIVEILEDHFSRLNAATASVGKNIQKLEALRLSILSRTFFGRNEWPADRLLDLLEISIGGVWGGEPGSGDVDVRVLRVTEMKTGGYLVPGTAARRSISKLQLTTRQLQSGDILLEKSGGGPTTPVGRVGLVTELDEPSICANFMQLMRPRADRILPRFLHLYLHALYMRGGTESTQKASTNIRNLKASEYVEIQAPAPDLATQRRVVDEIEVLFRNIIRLEPKAATATSRAESLRKSLLEDAFTGRLTGRRIASKSRR